MYKWFSRSLYITLPACFVLRVVQYYTVIDDETGYFVNGSAFSHAVNTCLIICALLYLALLAAAGKDAKAKNRSEHPWPSYESAYDRALLILPTTLGVLTAFIAPGKSGFFGLVMAFCLLGTSSAVGLLMAGQPARKGQLLQLLLLSPVAYYILRLIFTFDAYTQVANISSYMLELFTACFLALFAMNFAKLMYRDGSRKTLLFTGAMALSGICASTLPALVVLILGFAYQMDAEIIRPFTQIFDLSMGIFIALTIRKLRTGPGAAAFAATKTETPAAPAASTSDAPAEDVSDEYDADIFDEPDANVSGKPDTETSAAPAPTPKVSDEVDADASAEADANASGEHDE